MIAYLSHLDWFWGNQVNQSCAVKKHPDSEKWLYVQHNYNRKRVSFIPVLVIILILIGLLGLNYLGVITLW